ncbi:hypothetical protein D3C72_1746750 [compost metagenome]
MARATACAAMPPDAPGLFSTTTLWPSAVPRGWAIRRAAMSVVPPGAADTISVTGRLGKSACALAALAPKVRAAAIPARRMVGRQGNAMGCLLGFL